VVAGSGILDDATLPTAVTPTMACEGAATG
jgi:hypothetical protein